MRCTERQVAGAGEDHACACTAECSGLRQVRRASYRGSVEDIFTEEPCATRALRDARAEPRGASRDAGPPRARAASATRARAERQREGAGDASTQRHAQTPRVRAQTQL